MISEFLDRHRYIVVTVFIAGLVFTTLLDTVATISIWVTTRDANQLTNEIHKTGAKSAQVEQGITDILALKNVSAESQRILVELCMRTPGCIEVPTDPTTTTTHPRGP